MSIFNNVVTFNEKETEISGLTNELKAIYINSAFNHTNSNIVVVTNSLYEASKFYQILSNYNKNVLFFPMDDFLTSEALAISPELKITRLETLNNIIASNKSVVITNLMGYLRFLPSLNTYKNNKLTLKVSSDYKINELVEKLFKLGYQKETIVNKTGEIAVRGFVVDIFPISSDNPIRIEFWGDTIESIRIFNVDNQLTIKEIDEITIHSNTEFLVNGDIDTFNLKQRDIIKYENRTSLIDYLDNPLVFFNDYLNLENSYNMLLEEMTEYSISQEISANTIYMNDFYEILPQKNYRFLSFDNKIENNYSSIEIADFIGNDLENAFNQYLKHYDKVVVCLSNRYKVNKILDTVDNNILVFTNEEEIFDHKINLIVKNINKGFIYNNVVFLSEQEIFKTKENENVYKTNFKLGTKIRDINKLQKGDFVVHTIHGIGRYEGIKTLTKNGLKKDYLQIEYKDNDKLYIPVEKIELINKYSFKDGFVPKINKLGGTEWIKTKLKAQKKVEDIALELLKLYALREASRGYAFPKDDLEQIEFEKEFKYTETVDQLKVTEEIKKDMEKAQPMDRLLCGDVGYGKTEVAFRAMFKAIMGGKQVALLCPTTILSNQHYQNALDRFKSFPVNIALLNRFVPSKQIEENIEKIKEGKTDIVIGTHRLLSDDVEFKDLGLLVIDEEQRFGVKHKEKIKQLKNNIDVLTLSATPIPRTLQMSMAGLRSLSLIETPPVNRYPIQTYVLAHNNQIIKDAIYKELSRKGQVFILYNKIEDMNAKAIEISKLVPDAKIVTAHGKMTKTELEEVMFKFTNKEFDVLLCTTIIETGIDIPTVNTLIIIDADHFGLSQLYQIRGRVGRSNKIAYCYLMYNKQKILSDIAIKRLNAIKEFTELGSGFAIAMRDLSIRGAGDILGSEQAGFIDTIGVELFMEMLNNEIKQLKGEKIDVKNPDIQPLLDVETAIDDSYVKEEELKIEIHKKINEINSYEKLHETKIELEDRFGNIGENLLIYMYEEWFEKMANKMGIKQVKQTKNFIEIMLPVELTEKVNGELLFIEASRITRMFRFALRSKRLIITLDTVKLEKHFIYYLIELMEIINKAIQ
ncbi:MAG: transcription-repair coupling factor [Firmicutes bacterium]|nr:transcription-repair coupling factor [Bacillota bacterium]